MLYCRDRPYYFEHNCKCHILFDLGCYYTSEHHCFANLLIFIKIAFIFKSFPCIKRIFIFFIMKFKIIFLILLNLISIFLFELILVRELFSFKLLYSLEYVFSFVNH